MLIKPSIRSNIFINANPLGLKEFVGKQIQEVKVLGTFNGPKNVLIIGGSSGYGLSSRIALAFGADANTYNVSFESGPKGKRTGTAGWWNNIYFQEATEELNSRHVDFVGDAFSQEMKETVISTIKKDKTKIDLVVYSLAAGARKDDKTGDLVRSAIKATGTSAEGKTIDIAKEQVEKLTVEPANEQEMKDTVFVMGGSDWEAWIHALSEASCLNEGVKTISYTYIGGPTTEKIYRGGTLGKAKEDLEAKAKSIDALLKEKYKGEALISSSKAVVTKASVFIPQMPIYVACLYETMINQGIHESILAHKYRLFKDMIYDNKRIVDERGRIRLDHKEMSESVQEETIKLMETISDEALLNLKGTQIFLKEFYEIHGFDYEKRNQEIDVDFEALGEKQPK